MCDKKPMILVLAGPNGSGKSTITQYFDIVGSYTNAEDKIRSRYYKSIKKLLEICDIMHVYDNTYTPVRIIRKHKNELSIYPNELWTEKKLLNCLFKK